MSKVTAWDKKEKHMVDKLPKVLKMCPHSKAYEALSGRNRYLCKLLPNLAYDTPGVSSHNFCTYEDVLRCPLMGNK